MYIMMLGKTQRKIKNFMPSNYMFTMCYEFVNEYGFECHSSVLCSLYKSKSTWLDEHVKFMTQ